MDFMIGKFGHFLPVLCPYLEFFQLVALAIKSKFKTYNRLVNPTHFAFLSHQGRVISLAHSINRFIHDDLKKTQKWVELTILKSASVL
jgi:hypothetical protein